MKKYQYLASAVALLAQSAFAEPQQASSAAALQAKEIRLDVAEKQKNLTTETTAEAPAPVTVLELPLDEADSPGATKQ